MTFLKKLLVGLSGFRSIGSGGGVRILLFHDLPDADTARFRELLQFIGENYRFADPSQFEEARSSKELSFIISFDDGFRSQLKVTREFLDPIGVKALFFICPSFAGLAGDSVLDFIRDKMERKDVNELDPSLEPIGWDELGALAADGHEVGCHTMTHARLSAIDSDENLEKEIVAAAEDIETKVGQEVKWFAYPFGNIGSINRKAMRVIAKKYRYCCSGLRGINNAGTKPMCIAREYVNLKEPFEYSSRVLLGALDGAYFLKNKKLTAMTL